MAAPVKTILLLLLFPLLVTAQTGNFQYLEKGEHELTVTTDSGHKLRIRFPSNRIVRFSWVQPGEVFLPDDQYEMVADHTLGGTFEVADAGDFYAITTFGPRALRIDLQKAPFRFRIFQVGTTEPLLTESEGIRWEGSRISESFQADTTEHFCGLGHQAYGLVGGIDLRGKTVSCNYGEGAMTDWGAQGVLTVPFYMSGKGYGIFLNSTFPHQFVFGEKGRYGFKIDTKGFKGQMDYYFILGPSFSDILNRYTQLTGRPRLPQRSFFGLQLSDKGYPDHPGAEWWKQKIAAHRAAGLPFDHIVNDNRWRAGSGAWSESWFEWDSTRYPDPAAFNIWCRENNVTVTLDLNRNNIADCAGWKPVYNLPDAEKNGIKHPASAPDYSNPEMRNWIWELFWKQSFDPALGYPGDALWIDETDELMPLNDSVICANGRAWAENENYYPFLIAKAIVQEGWDNENQNEPPGLSPAKRPMVWMRSATAGAQRYATYWTGDIPCSCDWMRSTVRAMQVAGLSGFPYFNHDAGGFREPGPSDPLYIQWAMGLGSLSPIWRPHGIGPNKRWPLDRSSACQDAAQQYGRMRYELMPYVYSNAYQAYETGKPMARAMVLEYQDSARAWIYDLQYLWGDALLVAPVCSASDTTKSVWLPGGQDWYDFWTDSLLRGGQVIEYPASVSRIPLFVKAGGILPRFPFAASTADQDPSRLRLDVYAGQDGRFILYEDDGVSEKFRTAEEKRTTRFQYVENGNKLRILPATGTYPEAVNVRQYMIVFHGLGRFPRMTFNNQRLKIFASEDALKAFGHGIYHDRAGNRLIVLLRDLRVERGNLLEMSR